MIRKLMNSYRAGIRAGMSGNDGATPPFSGRIASIFWKEGMRNGIVWYLEKRAKT